jgi:hypothetical protein
VPPKTRAVAQQQCFKVAARDLGNLKPRLSLDDVAELNEQRDIMRAARYNGRAAHRSRIGVDLASPSRKLGGWCILSGDMTSFFCAYLGREVRLSGEREAHIAERHPDLLPEHRERIGATLADPDQVRRSPRFGAAKLFLRWFPDARGGKHVVVVVVSSGEDGRHWIITAYIARKLAEGEVEWARS